MVEPGQVVTQVLKAEFGEEAMAKLSVTDAEREKISWQIDRLFHNGVEVTRLIYLPFSMKEKYTPGRSNNYYFRDFPGIQRLRR